ncbi:hypothetical protein LV476_08985 [Guyparkeria hydrothermalis]|nr:hypothetical protein [Guyparkeria hydrothermalis]
MVELMIAMVLGLIVLAGVGSVFLANKQSYATNQALARVQDAVRTAHAFVGREVRVAGYGRTCAIEALPIHVIADPAPDLDSFGLDGADGIEALVGAVAGAGERIGSIEVPADSSILTVRHFPAGSDSIAELAGQVNVTNANVQIMHNRPGFEMGDVVMVTDCRQADVFRVTNRPESGNGKTTLAHGNSANTANALSREYGRDAFVFRLDDYRSTTFFVGQNAEGGRSLYQRVNDRSSDELVRGVEDMRLGFHRADVVDDYESEVNGWGPAEWADVDGVRMELVLSDAEGRRGINGQPLSRPLTAVFAVRNRMDP